MPSTEQEMRELLHQDENKILHDTWYEYSNDKPLPTKDRDHLIEAIITLMIEEGDVVSEAQSFRLSDLAREMGINPKIARDKIRRHQSKGLGPNSVKPNGWWFHTLVKQEVADIIKPRRKQ